jgi:hypothetical protein
MKAHVVCTVCGEWSCNPCQGSNKLAQASVRCGRSEFSECERSDDTLWCAPQPRRCGALSIKISKHHQFIIICLSVEEAVLDERILETA